MDTYTLPAAPADKASPEEVRRWRSSRAASAERTALKQAQEQKAIDDAKLKQEGDKLRAQLVADLLYWSRHQKFQRAGELLQRAADFIEKRK